MASLGLAGYEVVERDKGRTVYVRKRPAPEPVRCTLCNRPIAGKPDMLSDDGVDSTAPHLPFCPDANGCRRNALARMRRLAAILDPTVPAGQPGTLDAPVQEAQQ